MANVRLGTSLIYTVIYLPSVTILDQLLINNLILNDFIHYILFIKNVLKTNNNIHVSFVKIKRTQFEAPIFPY